MPKPQTSQPITGNPVMADSHIFSLTDTEIDTLEDGLTAAIEHYSNCITDIESLRKTSVYILRMQEIRGDLVALRERVRLLPPQ